MGRPSVDLTEMKETSEVGAGSRSHLLVLTAWIHNLIASSERVNNWLLHFPAAKKRVRERGTTPILSALAQMMGGKLYNIGYPVNHNSYSGQRSRLNCAADHRSVPAAEWVWQKYDIGGRYRIFATTLRQSSPDSNPKIYYDKTS